MAIIARQGATKSASLCIVFAEGFLADGRQTLPFTVVNLQTLPKINQRAKQERSHFRSETRP